ncbi:hypothetical protein PgNI_11197 [Pyricularia grisea]|uniref:Uncharacterized protein n=1 Tax=Pyricularia grisea TaxID=148305 RepID=A0A6P8APC5_PYRGI|nr:hypothetical protein PgNI_11197 [Pyricularia grisea]TLD03894.1 hypothetical protein PgNI_11197 [Pyricularia grisea]
MSYHPSPMAPRPAANACAVDGFDCFIGVEFEYLVPYVPPGKADPHPRDTRYVVIDDVETQNSQWEMTRDFAANRANATLHRQFRAVGIPAVIDAVVDSKVGHMDDDEKQATIYQYFAEQAVEQGIPIPPEGSPVEHRFWRLKTDGSAISVALHTLRRTLRFVVPRSAGFHVHLSSFDGGVDLLTVKKMISLVLLCEGMIYQMANPWRLKSKFSESVMSALMTVQENREANAAIPVLGRLKTPQELANMESLLKTMHEHLPWPLRPSEMRHEALEAVWASVRQDELRMRFSGLAVKRKGDKPTAEDPSAGLFTIEMRQFEGMVDPETTCAWVRFCVALFRIASTYNAVSYKAKMAELNEKLFVEYHNPANSFTMYKCTFETFMPAIGLPDAVDFWRRKSQRDQSIPALHSTCLAPTRLIPPLIW